MQNTDTSQLPTVGLGTCHMHHKQTLKSAIKDLNYRLIDCASYYKNEELIGEVLQELFAETEVQRKDLFMISKVWVDEIEDIEAAIKRSLSKLKLDQLDLYLVHWPVGTRTINNQDGTLTYQRINVPVHKIWEQMENMVQKGLTKHIGLSNFNVQMIWDLLTYCKIKPYANEIELNPLNVQNELIRFLLENHIKPIAYCPLARAEDISKAPNLLENEVVVQIAQKYQMEPAQVLLKWGIQRGHIVIPKSNNVSRLKQNIESSQFQIEQQDIDSISGLDVGHRICAKYPFLLGYNVFA